LSKLEGEVIKFQEALNKLCSDTAIEILSVSNSMEGCVCVCVHARACVCVCEKLDDRLTGHIEEIDRCIDRFTEELNAKTKVLGIDLNLRVENTDRPNNRPTRQMFLIKHLCVILR
jgi:hypothetical protein